MEKNQAAIILPGLKNKHMEPNLRKSLLLPVLLAMLAMKTGKEVGDHTWDCPSIGSIPAPPGYHRMSEDEHAFGTWLRNIRLKKDKHVYLFNGELKRNQSAQFAVLDISVGKKDLQQCADAVMRLRAEYLYAAGRLNEIRFLDNNHNEYTQGKINNADQWQQFLESVFMHCGTLSLQSQLRKPLNGKDIQLGDVLIQGGSPGHAMIVVDLVENDKGQKLYLLAQSYMPAQDIHIVVNPTDARLSPWYVFLEGPVLTPEWIFKPGSRMKW